MHSIHLMKSKLVTHCEYTYNFYLYLYVTKVDCSRFQSKIVIMDLKTGVLRKLLLLMIDFSMFR